MASIKNRLDSSRLHALYERSDRIKALDKVNRDAIEERKNRKLSRAYKREENKLEKIRYTFANIEEEIAREMPKAMRSFNTKDYWKRREAIQTWRKNRDKNPQAYDLYQTRMKELDAAKYAKEEIKANQIRKRLSKKILSDPDKIEAQKNLYEEALVREGQIRQNYEERICSKAEAKIARLDKGLQRKLSDIRKKVEKKEKSVSKTSAITALPEDVLLRLEHLTMQFGGLKAVDDLSFDVKKGEIFGLIGPNGAGKTTVFNCITQFYKPTKGSVYFTDRTGETILMNKYKVHNVIKHGIVRTFQNVELIKEVSVLDNLLIGGHVQYHSNLATQFLHLPRLKKEEIATRKKALEVLEFMGLSLYKDMYAWGLPYGVLKKIEIARTLMNQPQLIILDEPAAGLNDSETAELAALIRKIREKYNCTILLVEHDMGLVMDICDTVCAISFGKLLGIGTTEEIQANPKVQEAYLGSSEE